MNTVSRQAAFPRLCVIGPLIGRHEGYVTTQGLILADRLAADGYPIVSASDSVNRYVRAFDIVRTLIRNRHDVDIQCLEVYGEKSFVVEDVASCLGKAFRQRIVMVLQGGSLPTFVNRFPSWTRRVLRRADLLVTPSEFVARAVREHGFQPQVIPNLIDLSRYPYRHRSHATPRLLWMRSFHPIWNPLMAVRVLARLRASLPEATLVMAGQAKGLEHECRRLAIELGVSNAVRFPGFLKPAGKLQEADAADIFINTNRIDNMPVAVIEACAFGLPVVATSVGGIPDLLTDEETGLLVPDDDVEAMASAIVRLVNDPELANRLSANGRRLAERFSWEQVRPLWESAFGQVWTGTSSAAE